MSTAACACRANQSAFMPHGPNDYGKRSQIVAGRLQIGTSKVTTGCALPSV